MHLKVIGYAALLTENDYTNKLTSTVGGMHIILDDNALRDFPIHVSTIIWGADEKRYYDELKSESLCLKWFLRKSMLTGVIQTFLFQTNGWIEVLNVLLFYPRFLLNADLVYNSIDNIYNVQGCFYKNPDDNFLHLL